MTSFETELTALLPRVRRFARALTGGAADGDDLVQIAMERALRNRDRYQPGTRMDMWLFRIVRNALIDQVRQRRRRPEAALEAAEHVAGDDGAGAAERRLMLARTLAALDALPIDQREVLALVALDGMSYREAAEALDIPIGTVMSRIARGRAAIAAAVGQGSDVLT